MAYILNFDNFILNFIQANFRNNFLDTLMKALTYLGEKGLIWIVIAFILLCMPKYRRTGIILVISLIVTALIGEVFLKNFIGRIRPCNVYSISTMLIPPPQSFSFPSGHAASSFASAFVIYKLNKNFGIFAYFFASLLAFSRMYLFVHYPTDILGGIFLGTIVAVAVCHIFKNIKSRQRKMDT